MRVSPSSWRNTAHRLMYKYMRGQSSYIYQKEKKKTYVPMFDGRTEGSLLRVRFTFDFIFPFIRTSTSEEEKKKEKAHRMRWKMCLANARNHLKIPLDFYRNDSQTCLGLILILFFLCAFCRVRPITFCDTLTRKPSFVTTNRTFSHYIYFRIE